MIKNLCMKIHLVQISLIFWYWQQLYPLCCSDVCVGAAGADSGGCAHHSCGGETRQRPPPELSSSMLGTSPRHSRHLLLPWELQKIGECRKLVSTEYWWVQKIGEYRKLVSSEYWWVQKIGEYRKWVNTKN